VEGYEIELVGGPADGEVRTIATDRRELRFLMPLSLSPKWEDGDAPDPTAKMETVDVVYLRSRRLNSLGRRIYEYQK